MSAARRCCAVLRRGPPHRARRDIRQRLRRRERRQQSPYAFRSARRRRRAVVGSAPCTHKISANRLTKPRRICLIREIGPDNRSGTMATGRQVKAAILVRRAAKGPRKRRTRQAVYRRRPGARTRPGSGGGAPNHAEAIPTEDARGWSGRSSNCRSSSRNYVCAASLSDGSIELSRHPGQRVEGPRSRLCHSRDLVSVSLISGSLVCPGLFPRSNAGRFQVLLFRACPAMTCCRFASVPLGSA
jgi:hypothetical protein